MISSHLNFMPPKAKPKELTIAYFGPSFVFLLGSEVQDKPRPCDLVGDPGFCLLS